jgi:hypothetical protein
VLLVWGVPALAILAQTYALVLEQWATTVDITLQASEAAGTSDTINEATLNAIPWWRRILGMLNLVQLGPAAAPPLPTTPPSDPVPCTADGDVDSAPPAPGTGLWPPPARDSDGGQDHHAPHGAGIGLEEGLEEGPGGDGAVHQAHSKSDARVMPLLSSLQPDVVDLTNE